MGWFPVSTAQYTNNMGGDDPQMPFVPSIEGNFSCFTQLAEYQEHIRMSATHLVSAVASTRS